MNKEEYSELLKDPRWRKKRNHIVHRDNNRCVKCRSTKYLHVHHLKYEYGKMPWEYDDNDLITLCKKCHEAVHNIKSKNVIRKVKRIEFFYYDDEGLQEYLGLKSKELYSKFINKLIRKGIIYRMKGLLNGKVQTFYIDFPSNSITGEVFENKILKAVKEFKKTNIKHEPNTEY